MAGPNFRRTEPLTGVPEIPIGVLGYGWIGRAHSIALNRLREATWPPRVLPRLVAVCGRTEGKVSQAAQRFGYEGYYTHWEDLVADDEIRLLIVGAQAYLHAEPTMAALRAGKHVLCEKPLAATLAEARQMRDLAVASGLIHMTGLNYRFVPAIRLARDLVKSGALGDIHYFRGSYFNEFRRDPLMPNFGEGPEARGRNALNDIGSHLIDVARFVVGDIASVTGTSLVHMRNRPSATVSGKMEANPHDDTFHFVAEFADGPTGTMEGGSLTTGRKNQLTFEVNGTRGSLRFDLERLNHLEVYLLEDEHPEALGFRDVLVTEANHPYVRYWWP
ncbi:MAG: Gfo/Idh/MocA family oxidoreductase, partial [Dehalococcoidales bacterium]|nr:Gfo/Idh/MocA family oxidoreductase [Dehalococcoidales bacterium]